MNEHADRWEREPTAELPRWKTVAEGALGALQVDGATYDVAARTCAVAQCLCDVVELTFRDDGHDVTVLAEVAPDVGVLRTLDARASALCTALRKHPKLQRRFGRVVADRRTEVLRDAGAYGLQRGVLLPDTVGLPGRDLKSGSLGLVDVDGEELALHLHACLDPGCFCGKVVIGLRTPSIGVPRASAVLETDGRLEVAGSSDPPIARAAFETLLARDEVAALVAMMQREALFARYRAGLVAQASLEKSRFHPTRRA